MAAPVTDLQRQAGESRIEVEDGPDGRGPLRELSIGLPAPEIIFQQFAHWFLSRNQAGPFGASLAKNSKKVKGLRPLTSLSISATGEFAAKNPVRQRIRPPGH